MSAGNTAISRNEVISQLQTKSGSFIIVMPGARKLKMVTTILIEAISDEAPSRKIAKMAKSTPGPPCTESGAYIVQPVSTGPLPIPNSFRMKGSTRTIAAGGSSQKPQLLRRGRAMSGAPIISGMR